MTNEQGRIAVVGPGAVGGLVAALLHRAGEDVVAVARPDAAKAINDDGLTIRSGQYGSWTAPVPAQESVPHGARIILATKAFALPDSIPVIRAAVPVEIISLLNGLDHMQELRNSCPGASIAGAAITVEAARSSPSVIEHRSPFLRIAVPVGSADSATVEALREAGIKVTARDSEDAVL
ncbi:2-dehydropantoate 2-reductase [Arthrobacter sp. CAN_A6]|uniref:ketopantoate reductase family protein n=1 Tax=Arthrobacter sp. CAN_A6 TaxID=2787721 RepID=UPI001A345E1F